MAKTIPQAGPGRRHLAVVPDGVAARVAKPVLRPLARLDVEQARQFVTELDVATAGTDPLRAMFLLGRCVEHAQSLLDVDRHGGSAVKANRYVFGGVDSPADFASRQYRNRWRRLEIRTDDEARHVVGAIEPHPDTGRRTWWAESAEQLAASAGVIALPLEGAALDAHWVGRQAPYMTRRMQAACTDRPCLAGGRASGFHWYLWLAAFRTIHHGEGGAS
jgi:hypothetical protein